MKNRPGMTVFGFLFIFCLSASSAFAGNVEYEHLEQELSGAVTLFQKLSLPEKVFTEVPRRDPMKSLIDNQGNLIPSLELSGELVLQGIYVSGGTKTVLVNESFYTEGSKVASYQILEIREDGILAQKENEQPTFFPLHPEAKTAGGVSDESSSL